MSSALLSVASVGFDFYRKFIPHTFKSCFQVWLGDSHSDLFAEEDAHGTAFYKYFEFVLFYSHKNDDFLRLLSDIDINTGVFFC